MSIRTISGRRPETMGIRSENTPWVRPPEWVDLPPIDGTTSVKLVGVWAVLPGGPDAGFAFNTVAPNPRGIYIDWGDGSVDNFADTLGQVNHTYNYETLSSSPVTRNGITYKTVLITVSEQLGAPFQSFNMSLFSGEVNDGPSYWVDLAISCSTLTDIVLYDSQPVTMTNLPLLERFQLIGPNNITAFDSLFLECPSLQSVPIFSTPAGVTFDSTFYNCHLLPELPALIAPNGTTFTATFQGCSSLTRVPILDIPAATTTQAMFFECSSLKYLPSLDLPNVTTAREMFGGCTSLEHLPPINVPVALDLNGMFYNCEALRTSPQMSTSSCTDFTGLYNGCRLLHTVLPLDTTSGTTFAAMFNNCFSLVNVPSLDISAGTNFNVMFGNCSQLRELPTLDGSSGISFEGMFLRCAKLQEVTFTAPLSGANSYSYMFQGCSSLLHAPAIDMASILVANPDHTTMFSECYSLQSAPITNASQNMALEYSDMDAAAIDEFFTNSLSVVSGKIISIIGATGADTANTTIATGKGWTVTT